jgi:hypothetical protein
MNSRISAPVDRLSAAAEGRVCLPSLSRLPVALLWLLVIAGFAARLAPLFDYKDHLFWNRMTEDGYLMQTVARNMALGLGMSTAEGTIPTNGVQPLATFLFAGLHFLAGGSKALGIAYGTAVFSALAGASAWFLSRLAHGVLKDLPAAGGLSVMAAAIWFASPFVIAHSMNGLETGLYYLAIIVTLCYYFSLDLRAAATMRISQRVALGLLLGLAFLARNDAVFFIAALLTAHAMIGGASSGGGFGHRAGDSIVAAVVSLIVAAPWLIHNKVLFGSIVPMSGAAESHGVHLGANLMMIPANLLQAELLYVPIRKSVESSWWVATICSVVLTGLAWLAWTMLGRRSLEGRRFCLLTLLFALCVSAYYGVFFGAPWFVSRYLSALSPMLAVLSVVSIYLFVAARIGPPRRLALLGSFAVTLLLLITVVRMVSQFVKAQSDGHRQVVEWVQRNVDDRQWVGAVQTGTLGYFHDRTINLDGKVNPRALRELKEKGDVRRYVLEETPINYIVDWSGIAGWVSPGSEPRFKEAFEVVVNDKAANIAVIRRIVPIDSAR